MTAAESKGRRTLDLDTDSRPLFDTCKDFLCPPETRIQEWFPSELQARLRAQALDPYGLLETKHSGSSLKNRTWIGYRCKNERCHAKLIMRVVDPDPEGNTFGLYGCSSHQHPLTRKNKSEIIFRNRAEAEEFFEKNLRPKYRKQKLGSVCHPNGFRASNYYCRRKFLKSYGKVYCESRFALIQSMPRLKDSLQGDDRPHSLRGFFYHCHKNEQKYDRDELGGFSRVDSAKRKYYIRVINNQVVPSRARKKFTVQDVLEAQKRGFSLTIDDLKN